MSGAFDGVFAARGSASTSDSNFGALQEHPVGVFDEVFIRRGRWRKNPSNISCQHSGDVEQLAEHVAFDAADLEYSAPSLSDATNQKSAAILEEMPLTVDANNADTLQFIVKNTFIDTAGNVHDTLKAFLSERQVQSCPAGTVPRLFSIDEIISKGSMGLEAGSVLNDVLNTASIFGDVDGPVLLCQDTAFNTASTYAGETPVAPNQQSLPLSMHAPVQFATMEASFPPPPCNPPVVNASVMPMLVPPPPPPFEMALVAPVLRLSEALPPPELGGPLLPSIGSAGHHTGACKPCTFFHTRGCENKEKCEFCHLCRPGEKKKRLRAEKAVKRHAEAAAVQNARLILASLDALDAEADFIVE
jgi:hypothetical protein